MLRFSAPWTRAALRLGLAIMLLSPAVASAADVALDIQGSVTAVNNSPFAGGTPTQGAAVSDVVTGSLHYDDATAQASGSFTSFELTSLRIEFRDTTGPGDKTVLVPAALSSATRIIFDGATFQGLLLPTNVTGFQGLTGFGLTGLDVESAGFQGPSIQFNLGVPVVVADLAVVTPVPIPRWTLAGLVLALGGVLAFARGQTSRNGL